MSFFDEQDTVKGGFFNAEDTLGEGPAAPRSKKVHEELKAQHEANLAESNPSAGARANALVESATEGLKEGVEGFIPGVAKLGYHAAQAFGGNAVDPTTGKIPLWEDVKGMAAGIGEDIGKISAVLPSWLGGQGSEMPLEQYKKAGEAVGRNVGVVAAGTMLPTAVGIGGKVAKATTKAVMGPPSELALKVVNPRASDLNFTNAKSVANTLIDEVKTGKTKREILNNTIAAKTRLNGELDAQLSTPAAMTKKVKLQDALDAVDVILKKAAEQNNQPLFDRISKFRDSLEHNMVADAEGKIQMGEARPTTMTPKDANNLKKWIDDSVQFTEDAVEKGVNEAKFAARTALRNAIERQVPGSQLTLKKTGDLIVIEKALRRQELRPGFDDLLGPTKHIEGPLSLVPGRAAISKVTNAPGVRMAVAKWLDSLGTQQRANIAAQYANKATPEEALPTPPAPPGVDDVQAWRDETRAALLKTYREAPEVVPSRKLTQEEMDAATKNYKEKIADYRAKETEFMKNPLEIPEEKPKGTTPEEPGPLEGIDLNQATPAPSKTVELRTNGYSYNPRAKKLVVSRAIANDISDTFNMPLFHGAEFTMVRGTAPAILKLKKTMPKIFDKIPADKPLTVQVYGDDFKPVARHEGTHRALVEAGIPPNTWLDLDTAELKKATATKKTYAEGKRAEEVYADLMSGRADRLGLSRTEALQLMHDMTEHIVKKYGQEAADTAMRRFIPQKRVTLIGGDKIVTEPDAFKYQ